MSSTILPSATKILSNGIRIPLIGLGVYQSRGKECHDAVVDAVKAGYRHFDSALAYRNEAIVGEALRSTGINRGDLFFTTKLPPKVRGYADTCKAIEESLRNCALDYIDLYLIHAPYGNAETRLGQWQAIEEAVLAKKIRAAGVSNYGIHHLQELLDSKPTVTPQVNQIELHPWLCRNELVSFCRAHNIAVEAYSPLTRGQKMDDSTLATIANNNQKTPAQILIRWSLQRGVFSFR